MHIYWPLLDSGFVPRDQLRWLTLVSAVTASSYVLFYDKVLDFRVDRFAILFVLAHSFSISRLVARVRSEAFAFLYSQGFSRDALWRHMWLATSASVLATWLPCAVLILTPLRGLLQDQLQNPWFPLMAATEWPFLIWSLLAYVLVLPVFQYEWIRSAMPFRDIVSGHVLSFGFVVFAVLLGERFFMNSNPPLRWYSADWQPCGSNSMILGLFGRWMHDRLEVRS